VGARFYRNWAEAILHEGEEKTLALLPRGMWVWTERDRSLPWFERNDSGWKRNSIAESLELASDTVIDHKPRIEVQDICIYILATRRSSGFRETNLRGISVWMG